MKWLLILLLIATGLTNGAAIKGVDLHDGQVIQVGGTYYFYGTMYSPNGDSNCTESFTWRDPSSQWCGYGVSTSSSINGPWSAPTTLVANTTVILGNTMEALCMNSDGEGCFEPRMYDLGGQWTLWMNAPDQLVDHHVPALIEMPCGSPAGPCSPSLARTHRPTWVRALEEATGYQILTLPGATYLYCSTLGQTFGQVQLNTALDGVIGTSEANLGNLTNVESPGIFFDPTIGWTFTYSNPNCGYCSGTGTAYMTAASPNGPWTPHTAYRPPRVMDSRMESIY